MQNKDPYQFYRKDDPYLRTLQIHTPPKPKKARKNVVRVLMVVLFFAVEASFMWAFAESKIVYDPTKVDTAIGIKPQKAEAKQAPAPAPAPTQPAVAPTPTAPVYDMYLVIPRLGINAPVEPVGVTANGDMATSSSLERIAWYKDGTHPGTTGNSVFAGHFGGPAQNGIFRQLSQLQNGDEVDVKQSNGVEYKYKVYKVQPYAVKDVPLQELFGKTSKKHLNLITCYGNWNNSNWTYDQRLIAYTELVE